MKNQIRSYFGIIIGVMLVIPGFSHTVSTTSINHPRSNLKNCFNNIIKEQKIPGNDSIPKSKVASEYLQALLNFEPWAESVWHNYPNIPHSGYFGDGNSGGNGGIRGTCGVALSYAVLVRALPNNPRRTHWINRIEAALRFAEGTHTSASASLLAVDGKKWGYSWQSTLWAATMGFAANLVENDIDPEVVKGCKRVIAAEADRLSKIPPSTGYKLDTKAEENAWDSNIVSLAAAWMPNDPHAKEWLKTAKLYLANTYTVPSDTLGPLKKWIQTQTLFPSYALQNHGFYHPIYQMVAGMSMGDSYIMARTINPAIAKELAPYAEHNVEQVWGFLQGLILDSGELAYPSGLDWSLHDFEHISYLAWLSSHFHDPVAQWAEPLVAKEILYRQSINKDGRFVGESVPDGFYREAVEVRRVAMAYLHNSIGGISTAKGTTPKDFIAHYNDVGLIIQRTKNTLTTVSYGTQTMALVYPLNGKNITQRFLISPNTATLIGPGGETRLESFNTTKSGFRAELQLNDPQGRKSKMFIDSKPNVVVFVEMPSDSSKLAKGEWLLSAIENDPLTGGKRTIFWEDHSQTIEGRLGKATTLIESGWVNVDNFMGFVALPEGKLIYQAASGYNRMGAAEDYIYYKPQYIDKVRAAILLPGKSAEITKMVRKSVKWMVSSTACKLSFRMPDGKWMKVQVPLNH
jgi:hypothetical protein